MNELFKDFTPEVKEAGDDRTIEFVITKEVVDRDGDVVEIAGFDTKEFMKNPVFIYGHDYRSLPIGKVLKIRKNKEKDALLATVKYAEPEIYSFADTVYKLTKAGYGGAVSVGFIPNWETIEYPKNEKLKGKQVRRRIKQARMLELSQTPVPANQDALATGKSIQKALDDGIIDEVEYKEYTMEVERVNAIYNKSNTTTVDKDIENTVAEQKSKIAELELKLKEYEMVIEDEGGNYNVYTEILDKMFTGTQASDKEVHTDEHTVDELGIEEINKLYEDK